MILDRVFTDREGDAGWSRLRDKLIELLGAAAFPPGTAETVVTLPLQFGGPARSADG